MLIDAGELKADLNALDAHFWAMPDEEKAEGLSGLASRPPDDDQFLTTCIWWQFGMSVTPPPVTPKTELAEGLHEKVMQELSEMKAAANAPGRGSFTMKELSDPQNCRWSALSLSTEGNGASCRAELKPTWNRFNRDTPATCFDHGRHCRQRFSARQLASRRWRATMAGR